MSGSNPDLMISAHPDAADVFTPGAVEFLVALEREFGGRRRDLLAARAERQERLDAGERPDFLAETASIRSGGGSYSVKGQDYTARVDYSNASDLKAIKGVEYKGTCRLEGARCYHYGTMSNGAVFDEVWEKVNRAPEK